MEHTRVSRIAAEWWASALRRPTFEDGDASPRGRITAGVVEQLAAVDRPTEAQVVRFTATLVERIAAALAVDGGPTPQQWSPHEWYPACRGIGGEGPRLRLAVDYHPNEALSEGLIAAGIEECLWTLPWKTRMDVERDLVVVHAGRGAPPVTLFGSLKPIEEFL